LRWGKEWVLEPRKKVAKIAGKARSREVTSKGRKLEKIKKMKSWC